MRLVDSIDAVKKYLSISKHFEIEKKSNSDKYYTLIAKKFPTLSEIEEFRDKSWRYIQFAKKCHNVTEFTDKSWEYGSKSSKVACACHFYLNLY